MKILFDQIELQGKSYNVIVTTKFGTQLCSASGDMVFHTQPLLTTGITQINSKENNNNPFRKISNKRRK